MNITKLLLAVFSLILFGGAVEAQDPVPIYPENYKVLLENERVRVLDFQLKKGAKEDFHAHPAAVTYVIAPFKICFTFRDGTTNSNYFMRFEVWRNHQALEEHKMTPHLKASFERRKNKGWMTEITTWKRVSDGTP